MNAYTSVFSSYKHANCVARHGAFCEDDNTMRVMRMSMQTANATRAAGRSGVNSLWSPAPIGRAIMLC